MEIGQHGARGPIVRRHVTMARGLVTDHVTTQNPNMEARAARLTRPKAKFVFLKTVQVRVT